MSTLQNVAVAAMGTTVVAGIALMGLAATTNAYEITEQLPEGGTSTLDSLRLGGMGAAGLVLTGAGLGTAVAGTGMPMRVGGAAAAVVGAGTLAGSLASMALDSD